MCFPRSACQPNETVGEDVWCQAAYAFVMLDESDRNFDNKADISRAQVEKLELLPPDETIQAMQQIWEFTAPF